MSYISKLYSSSIAYTFHVLHSNTALIVTCHYVTSHKERKLRKHYVLGST